MSKKVKKGIGRRPIEYTKLEVMYEVENKPTFHERVEKLALDIEKQIDDILAEGHLDAFNDRYADGLINIACDHLVEEFKRDSDNLIRLNRSNNEALAVRADGIRKELKQSIESRQNLEDEINHLRFVLGKEAI